LRAREAAAILLRQVANAREDDMTLTGKCFCGEVEIEAEGAPEVMGYCHCASCRSWSASPVNAFSLWKPGSVKVTKGADKLGVYAKTPMSERQFCTVCGGHLMANHPPLGMIDVYYATIPGLDFKPIVHVNYGEKVLAIKDGLPKMKDFPTEFGGSGETLPE
jgi:hypothetical protein